jgi:hypothetical protein
MPSNALVEGINFRAGTIFRVKTLDLLSGDNGASALFPS